MTDYVIRSDGTVVQLQSAISFRDELRGFWGQFKDWRMLAMLPMFFASNYFYAYQQDLNGRSARHLDRQSIRVLDEDTDTDTDTDTYSVAHLFDGRTRALIALLTAFGAIVSHPPCFQAQLFHAAMRLY